MGRRNIEHSRRPRTTAPRENSAQSLQSLTSAQLNGGMSGKTPREGFDLVSLQAAGGMQEPGPPSRRSSRPGSPKAVGQQDRRQSPVTSGTRWASGFSTLIAFSVSLKAEASRFDSSATGLPQTRCASASIRRGPTAGISRQRCGRYSIEVAGGTVRGGADAVWLLCGSGGGCRRSCPPAVFARPLTVPTVAKSVRRGGRIEVGDPGG